MIFEVLYLVHDEPEVREIEADDIEKHANGLLHFYREIVLTNDDPKSEAAKPVKRSVAMFNPAFVISITDPDENS